MSSEKVEQDDLPPFLPKGPAAKLWQHFLQLDEEILKILNVVHFKVKICE